MLLGRAFWVLCRRTFIFSRLVCPVTGRRLRFGRMVIPVLSTWSSSLAKSSMRLASLYTLLGILGARTSCWRSEIEIMVSRFEAALAAGDADAASIIIDFYSRPGTFLEMPENVRAFCRASAHTNLRDWHSAATFTPSFERFSSFNLPVPLVRGSETPVPIVDVNKQLGAHIPRAKK